MWTVKNKALLRLAAIACLTVSHHALGEVLAVNNSLWATLEKHYHQAIVTAALHELTPKPLQTLEAHNGPWQLVTYTQSDDTPGRHYFDHALWVVKASELYQRCHAWPKHQLKLRLTQLLGLPPHRQYTKWHLEILQVSAKQSNKRHLFSRRLPAGIFRPCYSTSSLQARHCTYHSPPMGYYNLWLLHQSLEYYQPNGYPWTGLGYTYDWSTTNPSHQGLSEFVIPAKSPVTVLRTIPAAVFCQSS